jgi:UrcA family protein
MRPLHSATALFVLCSFSFGVSAEQTQYATVIAEPDVQMKVVHYGDLNLQRDEGVATLYRRIQVAAKSVCTQMNSAMPQVVQRARLCASDATSRAVAKVGLEALSTLHAARTQTDPKPQRVVAR